MQKKTYKSAFLLFLTFISFSSPAEAVLGYIKRGFKNCTGECDNQSKVCSDSELASWCRENCSHKADKNGRLMNGQCFEVITHNPQKNATQVTPDYARKELRQCNARLIESKNMVSFTKGVNVEVLEKLIKQLEGIVQDLGAPISKKVELGEEPQKYSGDLIAYIQGCNNLNDKISDFAYWSIGKTPLGGFKTVKAGSTKAQIDEVFKKVIKDNQR